ncbi:MAG: C10 family peptidase [Candidatus Delongbacteria bacterium]|nr:C10 family peptidase [Candidatus Delongbacteria bacterium]
MITRTLFLLVLACNPAGNPVLAVPVSPETAATVAFNWYTGMASDNDRTSSPGVQLLRIFTTGQATDCYLFSCEPAGFVVVSGDDATIPVIGYSATSPVTGEIEHPAVRDYFDAIQAQMRQLRRLESDANPASPGWQIILKGEIPAGERDREVQPLLQSTWHQGCGWNDRCPEDSEGPCGRVWAGCVATAMGQIMKYWAHPEYGEGSHSYEHPVYGLQTANFGVTCYDWNQIPHRTPTLETAQLLYHCGVAVNMDYGPDGSGATVGYTDNSALHAFSDYFRYDSSASYVLKADFTARDWDMMMRGQLDVGRPVLYVGHHGYSGHAFILDGYDSVDYFHINWGWAGNFDGYFYLNDLTPGSGNYTENQSAIIDLFPAAVNTPPVVGDIPDQIITAGQNFLPINLDDYVEDDLTPPNRIIWSCEGGVELQIEITNRVVTISPPTDAWTGSETIIFRATDEGNLRDEGQASFTVTPDFSVNDLMITINGTDLLLEWSSVTDALEYKVYRLTGPFDLPGALVGTTFNTTYEFTDELSGSASGFYIVRVVY